MGIKTEYKTVKPYITKDGSIIRELIHPNVHGNQNLSLAEAIVPPKGSTFLHKHNLSEEIYYILEGKGLMSLGDKKFNVKKGDSVCIPPTTPHQIRNIGEIPLKILCCCSSAHSHDDTELLKEE